MPVAPLVSPVTAQGPGAGVGHRRDLDRLLVERGGRSPRTGSTDGRWATGDRRGSRGRAGSAASSGRRRELGTVGSVAGGEQRLGEHGVGVRQPGLGPGPPGRDRTGRSSSTASASSAGARSWCGADREHLGRAERGERHRPRPRRAGLEPRSKYDLAHWRIRSSGARRTAVPNAHTLRPQQSSTPPPRPAAAGGAPVADRAGHALGVGEEPEGHPAELGGDPRPGLAARRRAAGPCRRCSSPHPRGSCGRRARTCRCRRSSPRGGRRRPGVITRSAPRPRRAARRPAGRSAGDGVPRQVGREPARLGRHRRPGPRR